MDELDKYCGRWNERTIQSANCDGEDDDPSCSRQYDLFVPNQICNHLDANSTYDGGLIPTVFAVHCQFCQPNDMHYWEIIADARTEHELKVGVSSLNNLEGTAEF